MESHHPANQMAKPFSCYNTGKALINSSHTPTLTEALAPAQTLAIAPIISSTSKLCQQLMKMYEITVRLLGQHQGGRSCKQPLKYEDHFKTAGANRPNQILFAALFLSRVVMQQRY